MKTIFLLCALVAITLPLQAQDLQLPAPTRTGGKALMETRNERRAERSFGKKDMPLQTRSDLLWAANGFNRPDKRTAPTASNRQEQEIYVIIKDKAYHHDARQNILKFIASGDFSAALGQGNITANAAVTIVIVADNNKSSQKYAHLDSGYISQNIYLYAASAGLGTVARGSYNGQALSAALKLPEKQEVTLVHPVGYLK